MTPLDKIKNDPELLDAIDWDMTPEEAVRLYLEWGNNWARGDGYVIASKSDYTTYFVVNCWSKPYYIYLIRRNSDEALELAQDRILGHEVADHGITVVAVCPGIMLTGPQTEAIRDATNATPYSPIIEGFRRVTIGRCSLPEEVANMVAFLATEAASYIHGTAISVGGGQSD